MAAFAEEPFTVRCVCGAHPGMVCDVTCLAQGPSRIATGLTLDAVSVGLALPLLLCPREASEALLKRRLLATRIDARCSTPRRVGVTALREGKPLYAPAARDQLHHDAVLIESLPQIVP